MKYFTQNKRFVLQSITLVLLAVSLTAMTVNTESTDQISAPQTQINPLLATEFDGADVIEQESVFVADGDTAVVKSFGTDLSYDITEIRAKAGSTITIRYENVSDMPHNIVFVNSRDDIQPVGVAGIRARDNGYVPQDEDSQSRIFANTELAKPGNTVFVTLTVPEPGTYPYICTYPGHFTMMQGDLISEE